MRRRFLPGIEVLLRDHKDWLGRRRIGLVSHLPAVDTNGITSAERLWNEPGIRLAALFGPEHGFFGSATAGGRVSHQKHPYWHIPVYSLYGEARKPTARMLRSVDIIVVDLQDLGARPYTYVSTLRYVLEKAAETDKPVIIADRPVPLPRIIDGPGLEPGFESFVGCVRAPMLYGMTPGEMGIWLTRDLGLNLDLRVARMRGYFRRHARGPDWPPWIPPSPGIRSWESAACYLATVFTEALPALDSGRSASLPFQIFGAPWMKSGPVCEDLARLSLPGVAFCSHPFQPAAGRYANTALDGVRIVVRNPNAFCPVFTGIAIIACVQARYGIKKVWNDKDSRADFFDKLYGTDSVRKSLLAGEGPGEIRRQWTGSLRAFRRTRRPCLLYR